MGIDNFGDYIGRQREVPDTFKKTILKSVLDHITVDYDHQEKVHKLYIQFRIPVFYGVNGVGKEKLDNYFISRPLKTLDNQNGQPSSVETYSTVTGSLPKVTPYKPVKSYSLLLLLELTSSNLWTSPYTPYQQEVYDITRKLHEDDGLNFKQVSDWFNENGYKTPRGKVFHKNHVWSIYIKKQRSIQRFSREYDHTVTEMKVDVVDIVPQ